MSIKKSDRKSFFVKVDLRSTAAWELFDEKSIFYCEEVVILQVMNCSNDTVIVELIRKEDYCKEKYYHEGKEIEVYKNESNM